jgi:hypothetical protein
VSTKVYPELLPHATLTLEVNHWLSGLRDVSRIWLAISLPFPIVTLSNKGHVLAIAVARAPSLVPCVEARELKYFLRMGDSTLQIPEYLIADLVLGRRQRPILELHSARLDDAYYEMSTADEPGRTVNVREARFSCIMENLSLTTAEDVRIGAVLWSVVVGRADEINRHLRAYLEVSEPQGPRYAPYTLSTSQAEGAI